jgi:putative intracellular protease/amidase/YHS domain-containing protein
VKNVDFLTLLEGIPVTNLTRRCSVPFAWLCLALACAPGLSARVPAREKSQADALALEGLDPVALVGGRQVKGKGEFSASSDGFRYLFVEAANKAKFEKEPGRYGIQFDGHCAMMNEVRALPDIFTVYKGRIYGFGSEGCRAAFRKEPERFVKPGQGAGGRRSVVILVFEGMELLDFAGPADVFAGAGYEVSTVAATRDSVACAGLINLTPRYTFADCPRSDIIVVPGGSISTVAKDKRVTDWLVRASGEAEVTLSVCTGAFVLARAGLLDGKEATTHWSAIETLRTLYPKVAVWEDRRVVDNGKVVTSAGVSAGIDGALHLVDRLSGRIKASETARNLEYHWQVLAEGEK